MWGRAIGKMRHCAPLRYLRPRHPPAPQFSPIWSTSFATRIAPGTAHPSPIATGGGKTRFSEARGAHGRAAGAFRCSLIVLRLCGRRLPSSGPLACLQCR